MADKTTGGTSPVDAIRHADEAGEYWSACEQARVLGYASSYRNVQPVIARAETACKRSGRAVADHLAHVRILIQAGTGAQREVDDVLHSRYSCYLVVQNADPEKPIVAQAQTSFAQQTRRAEIADKLEELAALPEVERRLRMRNEVVGRNPA
jgi:DNA-damage-inducible protein D